MGDTKPFNLHEAIQSRMALEFSALPAEPVLVPALGMLIAEIRQTREENKEHHRKQMEVELQAQELQLAALCRDTDAMVRLMIFKTARCEAAGEVEQAKAYRNAVIELQKLNGPRAPGHLNDELDEIEEAATRRHS